MAESDFKTGVIEYMTSKEDFYGVKEQIKDLKDWDDGYLAFSNREVRIADLGVPFDSLSRRINGIIPGAEGYLMEVGLWRRKDNVVEELYIERNGTGFSIYRWRLHKEKMEEVVGYGCYWREADVLVAKKGSIFKGEEISAIEVIVPEVRLNIFLTVKRS